MKEILDQVEIRLVCWHELQELALLNFEKFALKDDLNVFFKNQIQKRWIKNFSSGMEVLALIHRGRFSGFISYFHTSKKNSHQKQVSEIVGIYVIPLLRCKGLGRRLYEVFLQEVKLIQNKQIIVLLEDMHPILMKFYEAVGFKVRAEDKTDQSFGCYLELEIEENLPS